jgi:hypothetical protein
MSDDTLTDWQMYRAAEAAAESCAQEWLDDNPNVDPENGDVWDYAHECADGSEYVIYTGKARAVWSATSEVQEYEEGATEGLEADADIDQRITATVYTWFAAQVESRVRELWDASGGSIEDYEGHVVDAKIDYLQDEEAGS